MLIKDNKQLELDIKTFGEDLKKRMKEEIPGVFDKNYWQGHILDWAMRNADFKTDMFRLTDVLPVLRTNKQVAQHVREYLLKDQYDLPGVITAALKVASGSVTAGLGANAIRNNVVKMAERFIIAIDPAEAQAKLSQLYIDGLAFTVNLLSDATVSYIEARNYQKRYLDLIDNLSEWENPGKTDYNQFGQVPYRNISIKMSLMDPNINPADPAGSLKRLKEFVLPIFLRAKERNIFINVDLEQYDYHEITYRLFEDILSYPELKDWTDAGVVVQAYLKNSAQTIERILALVKNRGAPLAVRLVKGAYWDYEFVRARQHGYPCPVFTSKSATDANYERLTRILFDNINHIMPAFGSHNLRSLSHALVLAETLNVPKTSYEIQMLYGMAEPEQKTFQRAGNRVRVYTPIGGLLPGMAYLVRRLLENTSNQSFLRLTYHEKRDVQSLLVKPEPGEELNLSSPMKAGDLKTAFDNCPYIDFTDSRAREKYTQAIKRVRSSFPIWVPIVINGKKQKGESTAERRSPSNPDEVVANIALASVKEVETAVSSVYKAWPEWRDKPVSERAMLLENLADRLQTDRFELAALEGLEEAKPWREADADVAEAIDFCRYYARQSLREIADRNLSNVSGEQNILFHEGRGPAVIIAPWNFPLAILCGMTTAALVSGNPVLIKPSGLSSAVAYAFFERIIQAGFPKEVVQFLPGRGSVVGKVMVEHPLVAQIAFTGSREVGLSIIERAGRTKREAPQVKRVICEMGGKNATIVDEDADIDETVKGVLKGAFGYAGQKCSACSRVIVVGQAWEPFTERLVEACRSILIGPADAPGTQMNAVIDQEACDRLLAIINNPGEGADALFIGKYPEKGWYVPPALFHVSSVEHPLMQKELFGPIVALMKVKTFEEALTAANASEYALTGSVYSRSPENLDKARRGFKVGNLYLNRGSTGAMVSRQPFGGFRMSGTGTKAGGPGYLLHFADPRVVTENTMRRGFASDVDF